MPAGALLAFAEGKVSVCLLNVIKSLTPLVDPWSWWAPFPSTSEKTDENV